jgi:hypothetical protein
MSGKGLQICKQKHLLDVKWQVLWQLKAGEYQVDARASLTFVTSTIVVVLTKEVSGSITVPNNM